MTFAIVNNIRTLKSNSMAEAVKKQLKSLAAARAKPVVPITCMDSNLSHYTLDCIPARNNDLELALDIYFRSLDCW